MKLYQCTLEMLRVLLLLTSAALAAAHVGELGPCPRSPRQADLQLVQMVGLWYEQMRYIDPGNPGNCTRLDVQPTSDGKIQITETEVSLRDGNTYEKKVKLAVTDDGLLAAGTSDYMVVDTDYTDYSVLQLCKSYQGYHARTLMVLTRERQVDRQRLQPRLQQLQSQGLHIKRLVPTPQDNCPRGF